MATYKFIQLLILIALTFHICSADTGKLILKSFNMPYCVVINKNVTVDNCTWHRLNESTSKPMRLYQQQITIHTVESSDTLDNTSPEVESGGSNHTFLIRVNHSLCLVLTSGGVLGTGKCTVRKARFVLRALYITNNQEGHHIEHKSRAFSIETRSRGECIGFSGKNPSILTKKACNYQPENPLGQLWTFCTSDGRCNISPSQQAPTTTTAAPDQANVLQGTTQNPQTATVASGTENSSGPRTCISFAGMLVIIHTTLFLSASQL